MKLSYLITIVSYMTVVEAKTAIGEVLEKLTRAEIAKKHWINRDKKMREVDECGKNKWKEFVGKGEGGDRKKGKAQSSPPWHLLTLPGSIQASMTLSNLPWPL